MINKKAINILLCLFGIALFLSYHIYYYCEKENRKIKTENYYIHAKNNYPQKMVEKKIDNESYLGILEIPKINLKQGFYNIDSDLNNVNKNVTLLKESTFPNKNGSIIYLAAHSGRSYLGYFKNIDKLEVNNTINLYLDNKLYEYVVTKKEEVQKEGKILVQRNIHENLLVLTTCSKNKDKQLIITAKLLDSNKKI